MRSIATIVALAGLSLLAAACTVNTAPERPTTVVTQPAPTVVAPGTTTYVTPRTAVVTPAY